MILPIKPIYCFSFLIFTFFTGFTCNEWDKLRNTLLNSFFGVFGNFSIFRKRFFHDSSDVGNGKKSWVVGSVSKLLNFLLVNVFIVIHVGHFATCKLLFLLLAWIIIFSNLCIDLYINLDFLQKSKYFSFYL